MFESVDVKAASPIQVPEPALQCISVGAESSEAKTQRPLQLAGEGVGGEGVGELQNAKVFYCYFFFICIIVALFY